MSDREGPRATASYSRNWLILFATLLLVGLAAFFLQLVVGSAVASFTIAVAINAIAALALIDGGWRLLGNEGFLGPGTGVDRLLALIQIVLALGVLLRLLV